MTRSNSTPNAGMIMPPTNNGMADDCLAPSEPKALYSSASPAFDMHNTGIVLRKLSVATPAARTDASANNGTERVTASAQ